MISNWFSFKDTKYRGMAVNNKYIENPKAKLAGMLIEKWGLIAGVPEGEDSSGRAKIRLQTPDELISRAIETADKAINEFERLGWLEEIPESKSDEPGD